MSSRLWLVRQGVFLLVLGSLLGCAPKVTFQVQRVAETPLPPVIRFLTIAQVSGSAGEIAQPQDQGEGGGFSFGGKAQQLSPEVNAFVARPEPSEATADLVRAAMVDALSTQSSLRLLNTTPDSSLLNGSQPDAVEVAALTIEVRYNTAQFLKREQIAYLVMVENKGTTWEQQLLAKTGTMIAESGGAGFDVPVGYVERFAALEATFTLTRKSDGALLLPPQTFRSYYVRKWGGSRGSTHLAPKIRTRIQAQFQQDESTLDALLAEIDVAELAAQDPDEYLARGLHLRRDARVPRLPLEIQVRLAKEVSRRFLQTISDTSETAALKLLSGDAVAGALMQGNAYEDAIAWLLGVDSRGAEDEYLLGLAYEATGQLRQARIHYEAAQRLDSGNSVIQEALQRMR